MVYDKVILSEKVAEDIRQMIIERDFQPGDKLPNEIEMTKLINVSRSTVREAIKILVSTNILEVRRGKGTYVSENPGLAKDPLGMGFMEEDHLLADLFEVRLLLEPEMTKLAVQRGSQEELDLIYEAYEEVATCIQNGENHTEADIRFHNAIANATHNMIMNRIIPIINEGIVGGYVRTKDFPDNSDVVLHQHERIVQYMKEKNSSKAKEAMKEHILYGLRGSKKSNLSP